MSYASPRQRQFERNSSRVAATMAILLVAVPIVTILLLLFAAAWICVTDPSLNAHKTLFGWISEQHVQPNGHTAWRVGHLVPLYFLACFSLVILWLVGEGVYTVFDKYKEVLS